MLAMINWRSIHLMSYPQNNTTAVSDVCHGLGKGSLPFPLNHQRQLDRRKELAQCLRLDLAAKRPNTIFP